MTPGGVGVVPLVALASMGVLTVLAPVLEQWLGRGTGYVLAAGFLGVGVLLGSVSSAVLSGGTVTESWSWIPSLGVRFTLRLDGLASLFCLLVLGVGALVMAYCPRYLPAEGRHRRIYFLLTLFGSAMLGLVLAGDLVLLFVFWELTTVVSFFLIGAAGAKGVRPAVRALYVTGMGGLALLAAVVLLTAVVGSTDLAAVLAARQRVLESPVAPGVAALVVIAAFTKSAQFPFHFWLPGAMVAITPVSAYLHAATMVKAGIYLLLRFSTVYAGQPGWSFALVGAGLVTAVLGAAQALREHDLKALLAYSTVSQLGLLVAAIGVGTTAALAAALLHTFAHALFKATLFMLVGIIDREAGSRDIRELSGLMRVMPVTATLTGLAALSLAGIPPLIGFVSKESLFQGFTTARGFPAAGVVAGALAVAASALTAAYAMRIFYDAFAGPTLQRQLYEPAWAFLAPAGLAAVAGAVLGPAVAVLNPLMRRSVLDVEPWAVPPYFALWHGLSPELLMSASAIAGGAVLFAARGRVDRALQRLPRLGGEELFERGYRALLAVGARVGRWDSGDAVAPFVLRPVCALLLLAVVGGLATGGLPAASGAAPTAGDWVVLALLGMAVAGVVRMRSVLGAVALVGVVGLIMTVWFLLAGAPDVALTLLLAEVLTAVVAAVILRGLPPRFPASRRGGALLAGVVAVLAGLAAAGGTLALTGHRGFSPAGRYFLHAAEPDAGGHNVVNTILVSFRGLDTLGESSVLVAAALGLAVLAHEPGGEKAAWLQPPYGLLLAPAYRLLAPVIAVLSAYLFLRGHNEPGGGFIGALTAGAGIALGYLAVRMGTSGPRRLPGMPLLATGMLLGASVGLAAAALGRPFLAPFTVRLPGGIVLSSSLLFDLGVYLLVLGMMVTTVTRLGAAETGRW